MAINRKIWWWEVRHQGHLAFYLRSLMRGDFAPGQKHLVANYALTLDGKLPDPREPVHCACGEIPHVNDLQVSSLEGQNDWFSRLRMGGEWPPPTNPATCWHCNHPAELAPVKLERFAVHYGVQTDFPDVEVTCCPRCVALVKET